MSRRKLLNGSWKQAACEGYVSMLIDPNRALDRHHFTPSATPRSGQALTYVASKLSPVGCRFLEQPPPRSVIANCNFSIQVTTFQSFRIHRDRSVLLPAEHGISSSVMAETPVSPLKAEESATTREEMDFDDNEHEQETGTVSPLGHETPIKSGAKSPSPRPRVSFSEQTQEIPPQKPPRPANPQQEAENTLIEAFPSIDTKVIRAVLMASNGRVEPAFNALLGMSDPDFQPEESAAPQQPPRPSQRQSMSQMEADERLARQLAEQYNGAHRSHQSNPGLRGPNQQRPSYDDDDNDRSFFDDDLPEIGRNIQQGFQETQKKFNSWFTNIRKRIDGEDDDDDLYTSSEAGSRQNTGKWQGRQNFGPSQSEQMYGIRKSAEAQRRSTEAQRYDADPHELGDEEFERLELRDDEAPPTQPPRSSSRQKPNPDLFKSQPKPPQAGPIDEVDAADRQSNGQDPGKAKKWQPLTSVAPNPEEDNDPFSVGDDEDETKDKSEEVRKDDADRLKSSARASVSGASGAEAKTLQEGERSGSTGTRDKEMEDLLADKKD
nr:cue domain-containing protein 5 [Quercus suber]